jgi:hypothetical protein
MQLITLFLLVGLLWVLANTSLLIDQAAFAALSPASIAPSQPTMNVLKVGCLVFICMNVPNPVTAGPFNFLWHFLLTVFMIYIVCLTFIFMLPLNHARVFLTAFDANLGKPLPEMSYAEDCRVFTPENPVS